MADEPEAPPEPEVVRETILSELMDQLSNVTGATVLRDAVLPQTVPSGGLIILRDDGDTPQYDLCGCDQFQMAATVEIVDGSSDPVAGLAALRADTLKEVLADRTLGGNAVDLWLDVASEVRPLGPEGAAPMLGRSLTFAVLYWTKEDDPYSAAP